jgi:FkbH-like protein
VTLIREMLPEVEAVLLPEDPSRFVATLDALHGFEKAVVLADDIGKAEQYVQAAARTRLSATAANFEDYLGGLETRVTLRGAGMADLPRVAQLCAKTNQFNVSGRRHALGELEAMLASDAHEIICVSVADRFGDLGLVGVAVLREADAALHVDTLLMSCRALGRGVETALMNAIKVRLLARPGTAQLAAPFVPTAKNHPAAGYFAAQGLRPDAADAAGTITYRLPREAAHPVACDWLQILGDEA